MKLAANAIPFFVNVRIGFNSHNIISSIQVEPTDNIVKYKQDLYNEKRERQRKKNSHKIYGIILINHRNAQR